jgi:hypothetical protein
VIKKCLCPAGDSVTHYQSSNFLQEEKQDGGKKVVILSGETKKVMPQHANSYNNKKAWPYLTVNNPLYLEIACC